MKNIFISSTFRDMQAERDMVQELVLPALKDEARRYGDNIGVIDLRWGVDTSELETDVGSAKVLSVCLDEIDRSHPYMLIFLGERYGWIPEGRLIEKAVQGRGDRFELEDYERSVTALEIEYGALSEKYGDLEHCVVCFREPVTHLLPEEDRGVYAEQDEKGIHKLKALKEKMRCELGDRIISYTGEWNPEERGLESFSSEGQALAEVIVSRFVEMFRQEWQAYDAMTWQEREQLTFKALMENKLRAFVGRDALIKAYIEKMERDNIALILQGQVGSGKTAVMCKIIEQLQQAGKRVFPFFSSAGSMSGSAELLVKQMVYFLECQLGMEVHFGEGQAKESVEQEDIHEEVAEHESLPGEIEGPKYTEWIEQLKTLCEELPEGENVYFCIDALDQLYLDEHVSKLDFLINSSKAKMVLSCTDTFKIPDVASKPMDVVQIPALSREDAQAVVRSILESYSRNAYTAIEQEILKKKNVGNPLYISLLIQRLNMMDAEELYYAHSEQEIVALATENVRNMPDDLEVAAAYIVECGIERIGEEDSNLHHVVRYLAVSRNGLRMQDLQGIFAGLELNLQLLDVSRLMKYLDTFFYTHEDDRMDFTHKVIREGLLKATEDRGFYERHIGEYLKTLDEQDVLCAREGLYYARILGDLEFGRRLVARAQRNHDFVRAVKEEALVDEGDFVCALIDSDEQTYGAKVRRFFQQRFSGLLDISRRDTNTRVKVMSILLKKTEASYRLNPESKVLCKELATSYKNVGDTYKDMSRLEEALEHYHKAIEYIVAIYKNNATVANLKTLSVCYGNMGRVLESLGRLSEALEHYEKALEGFEKLQEDLPSSTGLRDVGICYGSIGNVLEEMGKPGEALEYYQKGLQCTMELQNVSRGINGIRDLSICYGNIGNALSDLGRAQEALPYYEKVLECTKEVYVRLQNVHSLREVSIGYDRMGRALLFLGRTKEARDYYEKSLKCKEEVHQRSQSNQSFIELSIGYSNMGNALKESGRTREAIEYFQKALDGFQEMHQASPSVQSMKSLSINYGNMGNALKDLGRSKEALEQYEKAMECFKEVHAQSQSVQSLRDMAVGEGRIGRALLSMGRASEALVHYEQAFAWMEEVHEKSQSTKSLKDLSIGYSNISKALRDLGRKEEALDYVNKVIVCLEEVHAKTGSAQSLRDLAISYGDKGNVLKDLRRIEESLKCYQDAVTGLEEVYKRRQNLQSLKELAIGYGNQGKAFNVLKRNDEALASYEQSYKCFEEVHRKTRSAQSLKELGICHSDMGKVKGDMGQLEAALECQELAVQCFEEVGRINRNPLSMKNMIIGYGNMGKTLLDMKRYEDGVVTCEKCIKCGEELGVANLNYPIRKVVYYACQNIAVMLRALGRTGEAEDYKAKAAVFNPHGGKKPQRKKIKK